MLIGDANGADRAVQAQFAAWNYPLVTVYFVGVKPRNNEGSWSVCRIDASSKSKDFEFYAAKDRQMAHDADCGLMIWDGESRGTLANVHNLAARSPVKAGPQAPPPDCLTQRRRVPRMRRNTSALASILLVGTVGQSLDQVEQPCGFPLAVSPCRRQRRQDTRRQHHADRRQVVRSELPALEDHLLGMTVVMMAPDCYSSWRP